MVQRHWSKNKSVPFLHAHLAPDYLKEAMVLGPIRGFRHLFDTDADSGKEER
tara:strand:+ start:2849 stop:3004 length:156 start_codon:yes stop_codon:yes gene_type:complete